MSIEIKVPVLPESVADAVIASWYKKPGDTVKRDEVLVDLETDKVILEVPSMIDGVVSEILFQEGETVVAEQVLAIVQKSDGSTDTVKTTEMESAGERATHLAELSREPSISPSARKLMLENKLQLSDVKGSGKAGRVLKEDVLLAMENAKQPKPSAKESPKQETTVAPVQSIRSEDPVRYDVSARGSAEINTDSRLEKRVPMTRLRARVAERLLQAQQNAAILTTFNEVNLKPIMELRSRYKEKFEKEFGVKLGFMSFFVKAAVEALKKSPAVNASIDGNDIVYHGFFDIGVAVSGSNGLVVPILRDADLMSIAEIEQNILKLATRARDNSLTIEEITGGTFTISNGGVFGSMLSTPILNPPQSAILGMHTIKDRAMVVDGEVVVLPMMYLALSYDHRIIDGREAVQFLVTIRDALEDPSRMLLGI